MRCPACGANADGAFCEYCGKKMPVERVETQTIHAQHVTVNNYYGQQPHYGQVGTSQPASNTSPKSRMVALLLCVFLGFCGAHRFYSGRILLGVAYLFTVGLFGIGWLVDIALAATGRMRDGEGRAISRW